MPLAHAFVITGNISTLCTAVGAIQVASAQVAASVIPPLLDTLRSTPLGLAKRPHPTPAQTG